MQMLDVVSVGSAVMDVLHTPDGVQRLPGGAASTIAIRLSRFGLRTGFIGRIGKDRNGAFLLRELRNAGVDTRRVRRDSFPTGTAHLSVTPRKSDVFSRKHYRPLAFDEWDAVYIRGAASLYIRATNPAFDAFVRALPERARLFVSFNNMKGTPDIRPGSGPAAAVFCNEHEYTKHRHVCMAMMQQGALIVVTRGSRGCMLLSRGDKKRFPAFPVRCIDPTGAGDAFAAGFMFGFISSWDIGRTARFANACGALATTAYGARSVVPSRAAVEAFLRKHKSVQSNRRA